MKQLKASSEQIDKLLKAGWLPRFIRKKFPETTSGSIFFHRKRLGMPPFPRGSPPGLRKLDVLAKVRRLRKAGWTYAKIGEVLGVSRQRVHQYIVAYKTGRVSNPR
jgi:hypothetical protein